MHRLEPCRREASGDGFVGSLSEHRSARGVHGLGVRLPELARRAELGRYVRVLFFSEFAHRVPEKFFVRIRHVADALVIRALHILGQPLDGRLRHRVPHRLPHVHRLLVDLFVFGFLGHGDLKHPLRLRSNGDALHTDSADSDVAVLRVLKPVFFPPFVLS